MTLPFFRFAGKHFFFHRVNPAFQGKIFFPESVHCLCRFIHLCGKLHGNLVVLLVYHIQIIQHSLSGDHFHPDSFPESDYGEKLHHSDFPGMCNMSTTACTGICSRKPYDSHLSDEFLFASVVQCIQFLTGRIKNFHRRVFPDFQIYLLLDFRHLFFAQNPAEINGDHVASHMKAYIVISVFLMNQTAYHMLAGMLLHEIKPACPVDFSPNLSAWLNSLLCIMKQFSLFLMNLRNLYVI